MCPMGKVIAITNQKGGVGKTTTSINLARSPGGGVELIELERRERRLREAIENVRAQYDYILIDCPPALNLLTVNALVAAQAVIIPMQCEYYAPEGPTALLNTIRKARETLNPQLEIEGLLRTMYDPRNNLDNEVSAP